MNNVTFCIDCKHIKREIYQYAQKWHYLDECLNPQTVNYDTNTNFLKSTIKESRQKASELNHNNQCPYFKRRTFWDCLKEF